MSGQVGCPDEVLEGRGFCPFEGFSSTLILVSVVENLHVLLATVELQLNDSTGRISVRMFRIDANVLRGHLRRGECARIPI